MKLFSLFQRDRNTTETEEQHETTDHGAPYKVTIVQRPEDQPQFSREYTAEIGDGFVVTLTRKTLYSRSWSGEITQRDGKWVLFDPERVADKVLDRDLVPLIEALVAQVDRMDREFMNSRPSEFVDENGTLWRRAD